MLNTMGVESSAKSYNFGEAVCGHTEMMDLRKVLTVSETASLNDILQMLLYELLYVDFMFKKSPGSVVLYCNPLFNPPVLLCDPLEWSSNPQEKNHAGIPA